MGGGGGIKVEDLSCSVSCDLSQRLILSHKFLYGLKKKNLSNYPNMNIPVCPCRIYPYPHCWINRCHWWCHRCQIRGTNAANSNPQPLLVIRPPSSRNIPLVVIIFSQCMLVTRVIRVEKRGNKTWTHQCPWQIIVNLICKLLASDFNWCSYSASLILFYGSKWIKIQLYLLYHVTSAGFRDLNLHFF